MHKPAKRRICQIKKLKQPAKKDVARIAVVALSWALTLLCMCAIFYFSSRVGDESADQSLLFMRGLLGFISNYVSLEVFRKAAHFFEFGLLSFFAYNAFYQARKNLNTLPPFILSFVYCVSDEIHQHFVDGRACRLFDIFIDTLGIIFGLLAFYAAASIIFKLSRKKM